MARVFIDMHMYHLQAHTLYTLLQTMAQHCCRAGIESEALRAQLDELRAELIRSHERTPLEAAPIRISEAILVLQHICGHITGYLVHHRVSGASHGAWCMVHHICAL